MSIETESMRMDILRGNIDSKISLISDNHKITVDAWDFRYIIQMKGVMPSDEDINFDRECYRRGADAYDAVRDSIKDVVISDSNPWRILKRAEYHSEKKSPLASELYERFAQLMGSDNQCRPDDMSLRDYILKLATHCDTRESKALGILLDRNNAPAVDRWYESMDLSGLYNRCFEDRIYDEICCMAHSYADALISKDSPDEDIREFSDRLFKDIALKMDAEMKSDINLHKAIQSDNLMAKLNRMIESTQ